VPVYDELTARYSAGVLSFAAAKAFLLDEYVGLPPGHPQSYASYITSVFTSRVDFAPEAVQGPDGSAGDLVAAAAAYEAALAAAGGVDVQLLGIGADGHIGFNEPGSSLASRTRLKTLTQQTRVDNARFFSSLDEVPRHVITQGVGTILDARHLVLVASGTAKAAAVAAAVEGPVTAMVPASALQLHPHVSVVVDEPAASSLRLAEYYRETYANKPPWQGL
jgi:glucosamine-6-phosphate deaminase